jgi:ParB family chromosome partitioning protein
MSTQTVPLSSLQPPSANPRTAFDQEALGGLAASIKADGLLQNLVVAPARGKKNVFRIISGERRYRALKLLEKRGDITGDYSVRVELRKGLNRQETLRLATVENLQREDLPPLDQAVALAGLIRKGTTLEDVVAQTGISATTIRRRLALNSLRDEARSALADGSLSLALAEALTLGSAEAQKNILAHMADDYHYSADEIKDHFLDGRPTVAMAVFPVEQYTGTITTDLFRDEETSYFDDAEQFSALQQQAVAELVQRYEETSLFVELTQDYSLRDWQYEKAAEGQPSGVLINLSPSGHVEIREGLIRPEIDPDTAEATADSPAARKPKPSYSAPLCRIIAWHKSAAVQELLLANPRKARELAAVRSLSYLLPHECLPQLSKLPDPQMPYASIDAQAGVFAKRLGLEQEDGEPAWKSLCHGNPDDHAVYEAVKTLSDDELDQLLVLGTVLRFGQSRTEQLDTGESLFNHIACDLGVDMRSHWTPDSDFLSRRTRNQLIAIAQECGFAEGRYALHTWKKLELVNGLLRHCQDARKALKPTPAQAKALQWQPEAMLFPAVDPDAPEADADEDLHA